MTTSVDAVRPGPAASAREVSVGLITGLMALVMSIGNGNLLFTGALAGHVGAAIGLSLLATGVLSIVALVLSSVRRSVSVSQAAPIAALALPLNAVAAGMAGQPDRTLLATAVVAVALTTLATGLALLLLGVFRLGRFVRFVPFPVVGGFLAGTGWLIVIGGAGIVLGEPMGAGAAAALASPEGLGKAATAAGLLVLIGLLEARTRSSAVVPAVIIAALLAFNVAVLAAGIPDGRLEESGWLVQLGEGGLWPPLSAADLGAVDWAAVGSLLVQAPVAVTVAILALLMNLSGMELADRRDIDVDAELRTAGIGNLLAGAGGGLQGYPSLSLAALARRLGGEGRIIGATVGCLSLAALVAGEVVMGLVPTPVFGGLLIWVGGSLLYQWLVLTARRMSVWEYLTILLIFAVVVLAGFAWAVGFGILAAVVLFAVEYGRIDIVRHILTGREYHSSLDQSDRRREALQRYGDAILIVRLHGFLFFGTADRLRRKIQRLLAGQAVRYLLIDFQRVTGLDSSAVLSFVRLAQLAERDGFAILLTGLDENLHAALARGGLAHGEGDPVQLATDLDHALEGCESALLAEVAPEVLEARQRTLAEHLAALLPKGDIAQEVLDCFARVEIPAGGELVAQGSASDDLFLIESGRGAVMLAIDGGRSVRLASIGPGAIVGEISFYTGKARTASVIADERLVAWRLERAGLARLEQNAPAVVAHFHRGIATMLADRLTATNRLVRYLAD